MALTNPLPAIQGSHILYGPDLQSESFLIVPGTSDYTSGGYVITANMCRLKMVQQAIVTGCNATAVATWAALPIFAETALASGPGVTGYTQFLFYVYVLTTGAQNAASLAGAVWQVQVIGY